MQDAHEDKVRYLRPADARAARMQALRASAVRGGWGAGRVLAVGSLWLLRLVWTPARWVICALLVLCEPLLRVVLVPLAFLGFLVTLVFGFALDAPHFPRWGMLAFSVGALLLYWLYLGVMSLFMRLPRDPY